MTRENWHTLTENWRKLEAQMLDNEQPHPDAAALHREHLRKLYAERDARAAQ